MLECSRGASLASANIAGKAPDTTWRYILEAAINLVSSLILVNFIGMKGVLLGTAIAGIYRTTDSIIYTNNHVLNRSSKYEFKNVIIDFILFFIIVYASHNIISVNAINYIELICYAIGTGIVVTVVYGAAFILLNKNEARDLIKAIKQN